MKKGLLSIACLGVLLLAPACRRGNCGPCKPACPPIRQQCQPCPDVCTTEEVPVIAKREVTICKKVGPVYFDCPDNGAQAEGEERVVRKTTKRVRRR